MLQNVWLSMSLIFVAASATYLAGVSLINQLQKVLIPMSDALNRLTTSVGGLIDQLASNDTELSAIAAELRSASPNDTDALNALADRIDAAAAAAKTAGDAVKDVLPAPAPVVTFLPTSISGSGPQTGSFSAEGGEGPYTFTVDDDGGGAISVDQTGGYSATQSGSAVIVATDAHGVNSEPTTVSISIST